MPAEFGVATVTIANGDHVGFSYVSSGVQMPLNIGFVPTKVYFNGASLSWSWVRGNAFGEAYGTTTLIATAGVLDILDGSGIATTNMATTTATSIGLLIGTNTTVNPGSATMFRGICYR